MVRADSVAGLNPEPLFVEKSIRDTYGALAYDFEFAPFIY